MAKDQKTIGEIIKVARKKKKLKAEQLAEALNVSRACVFAWERSCYIKKKNLRPLSTALDVSLRKLERLNGSPPLS